MPGKRFHATELFGTSVRNGELCMQTRSTFVEKVGGGGMQWCAQLAPAEASDITPSTPKPSVRASLAWRRASKLTYPPLTVQFKYHSSYHAVGNSALYFDPRA